MQHLFDLPGDPPSTRLVVAMSGGVDSSVVAALAQRAGYDVIGVTLQLYDAGSASSRKGACCAGADIRDARRVADQLGIPHYILDYEARFRASVVDRFADAYASGETPVPCIDCNRSVKFTDLLAVARDLGAAALATGHYAASRAHGGSRALYRAADPDRDQSYFLYATTSEQLRWLRFPLGDLTKVETRRLADGFGLDVADKPDSQDICFVPDGRYADLLARLRPDAVRPGDIVDLSGRTIGRHRGVVHYTVGQRRGIGLASAEPLYVVALDPDNARVIVGQRSALATSCIELRDVNWLGDSPVSDLPEDGKLVAVRVRSTRPPQEGRVVLRDGGLTVTLVEPEDGVSPGQACVLYDEAGARARVLGGGTIVRRMSGAAPVAAAA